jgi:hypothetical protein
MPRLLIRRAAAYLVDVVVACTGGRRNVHDYVAATEVCPFMAKRNR